MKIAKTNTTYQLNAESVDAVSQHVCNFLEQIGTERKNILRLRLTIENMLLTWMAHFGSDAEFSLSTGSHYGKPYINLTIEGDEFNPIEQNDDFSKVSSYLFAGLGLYPAFEYIKGVNVVSYKLKKHKSHPVAKLFTALAVAIIIGVLGLLGPEGFRVSISETLLNPIYNAFVGVLTTIAGPMIFLSVVWGIYGIGDAATLGKIGKKMLIRFTAITFGIVLASMAVLLPFSKFTYASTNMNVSGIKGLIELILSVFPKNIVTPFLEGNTIQIILIAMAMGCAMLALGTQTKTVAKLVEEANYIIQHIIEIIGSAIPFFIFIIVLRLMWSDSLEKLKTGWLPIVRFLSVALVISFLLIIYISIKEKVSLPLLIKKLFPSFLIGVTTASSAAVFGTSVACCDNDLGVNSKVTNFGLPLGTVLYKPASAVSLVAYSLFLIKEYNVSVSPVWIASTVIVITILTIALVPIPGGGIACYTILLTQIGVPIEALGIAVVLDIFADFISTGLNTILRECELVLVADKVNMLDKSKLQKAMKNNK